MSIRNRLPLAPLAVLMLAAIFMAGSAFGATLNEIRIDQGGADNDEVYSFTLVNYASVGAIYRF